MGGIILYFQVLCLDDKNQVNSRKIKTFMHALMANDKLFSANHQVSNETVTDSDKNLSLKVEEFTTVSSTMISKTTLAFRILVECDDIEHFDKYRTLLIDYLKELKFSNIRILEDNVSEIIATELYPLIYKLENYVRTFVVNFFLKNVGVNWHEIVLPTDTLKKIKDRKDNDKVFIRNKKIDTDVMLIDFDDLGKILHGKQSILSYGKDSSKANNLSIILNKIKEATDLSTLKHEVAEGSYDKYFAACFAQEDFESKWRELYYYRNKVAHNNYFSVEERECCKDLCKEITAIIDRAYKQLDTFKLSESDIKTLVEKTHELIIFENSCDDIIFCSKENGDFALRDIDESTLLKELEVAISCLSFVSLKYFVKDILGQKGYRFETSFLLINKLVDKGVLVMDKIFNPNSPYDTTTIKFSKSNNSCD